MSYVAVVGVDLRLPRLRPFGYAQGKLFSLRAKGFFGFASLAMTSDRVVALHQFGAYTESV